MRVLFDHQIFSYQRFGGISRYFAELISRLQRSEGVEITLALKHSHNAHLQDLLSPALPDITWLPLRSDRARFLARYWLNHQLSSKMLRQGRYDVFHPTFFDPSFLPLNGNRPFLLTLFDLTPIVFPELFPTNSIYGRLVTRRWINGMRTLVHKAARVIAISNNTKDDAVREFQLEPSKIEVIHLGNSLDHSTESEIEGINNISPYLLYVGQRNGYKNFHGFVQAVTPLLKEEPFLHVVCVGGGGFSTDELAELGSIGLTDRFAQIAATDSQLVYLYKRALAFVFPSLYEGFGLPVVEALSCGCPCILSRSSSLPEMGGDAAVYFEPNSPESMTAAIRIVLGSCETRDRLREIGHVQAKKFSWDNTATQTLQLYRDVAVGHLR